MQLARVLKVAVQYSIGYRMVTLSSRALRQAKATLREALFARTQRVLRRRRPLALTGSLSFMQGFWFPVFGFIFWLCGAAPLAAQDSPTLAPAALPTPPEVLTVAEARIVTAGLRPNPVFSFSADHQDWLGTGFNRQNSGGPPEISWRVDVPI